MFTHSSTPNQIRSMPQLVGHRREQRNDDEGDLEEVEEEGEEEHEDVDDDQEADLAARQVRPAGARPTVAVDALEHQAENSVEPIRMNITIAVMRMVDSIACRISVQVRRRCSAASTIAPTAPIAPASVGVAMPRKIVPSTRKISTTDGTMPHSTRFHSAQPRSVRASCGSGGTNLRPEQRTTSDEER